MSAILTTAKLICKTPEARQTLITAFRNIIAYTTLHEPGVLQYICAVPIDDRLGTEVYMIEEYVNTVFLAPYHPPFNPLSPCLD
jgi:quinol monooxygenase YgiN